MLQERIEALIREKHYDFYQLVDNIIEGTINTIDYKSKLDEFESVDIFADFVNIIIILSIACVNN